MTSLSDAGQSTCTTERTTGHGSGRNIPPPGLHKPDKTSTFRFALDQKCVLTPPATGSRSNQQSKGSDTTTLGRFPDGGASNNAPSVTLQDVFSWHEAGVNNHTQRIPYTIVPALLQGIHATSPSQSLLHGTEDENCVDENSSESGDVAQYFSAQTGKWKHGAVDDIGQWIGSPSPEFHTCNSVTDWVMHNRPILQDYADRQMSLPLGRRLEISIDEPSDFILGSLQLLVSRDPKDCTNRARLGPQLIENFVNIDRWAKEYFRSRHGTQDVDSDVSTLLTIVMNHFYEGQVQLIDRLVEFALENMRFCHRNSLRVEDFAFGFDFRMSQDLPFYVETSSQIREPLPIRVVEAQSAPEPVTTRSGRQVKPTKRAQQVSEQVPTDESERRNKAKNNLNPKMKDEPVRKGHTQPARQKKSLSESDSDLTVQKICPVMQAKLPRVVEPTPSKTASEHAKHDRPIRSSDPRQPPVSPGSLSTSDSTPQQLKESPMPKSNVAIPAGSPRVSGVSGSNPTAPLKIVIPNLNLSASKASVTMVSGSASGNINGSTSQVNALVNASETSASDRRNGHPRGTRPRSSRNWRRNTGRQKHGNTLSAGTLEVAPDKTQIGQSLEANNAGTSATVNSPVAPLTLTNVLGKAGDAEQLHVTDSNADGGENRSMSQSMHAEYNPPLSDPDHPRRKKRKINERED